MSTPEPEIRLEDALAGIDPAFHGRLIKTYQGLKTAFLNGDYDACGLRAGRFCEVVLRWLQAEATGIYTSFGTKLGSFKDECDAIERAPRSAAHESVRILMPRAISFLYTLRNKRGIGHEGGDVDANETDATTAVRIADWCVCELVRLHYTVSLEEAQAICDAIVERQYPMVWSVFGRNRVLDTRLSYAQQTLLLLYAKADPALPMEDLVSWTEHSNASVYRRDVLNKLHKARYVEYDRETQMVAISPKGVERVEREILTETP